jgi:hypothetical protein
MLTAIAVWSPFNKHSAVLEIATTNDPANTAIIFINTNESRCICYIYNESIWNMITTCERHAEITYVHIVRSGKPHAVSQN